MSALSGLQVLVVENDAMNAMLLEMQLQQAGAMVIGTAGRVEEAMHLVRERAPQAAILDYRLGDGETSEPVARLLTTLGIPFVLATGVSPEQVPPTFGAGSMLIKPYLSEDLVRSLLEARRKMATDS